MVIGVPGRVKYMEGNVAIPEAGGLRYIVQILDTSGEYPETDSALAIKKRWPAVENSYKQLYRAKFGKLTKGEIHLLTVQSDTVVVLTIAVEKGKIDTKSLADCFTKLAKDAAYDSGSVHMAKHSKGWKGVEKAINDVLVKSGINVTVYQ